LGFGAAQRAALAKTTEGRFFGGSPVLRRRRTFHPSHCRAGGSLEQRSEANTHNEYRVEVCYGIAFECKIANREDLTVWGLCSAFPFRFLAAGFSLSSSLHPPQAHNAVWQIPQGPH
jgi:hypothetical protein